jgi:large subunit ribosomal protein L10
VLTEFAKEHEKPRVKIGLVEGKTITADQVKHLASLASKPELLAQLGGVLQSPMAGFVGALNGLLYMMVGALEALKNNRVGETTNDNAN